jgi:aspartokinase-like uncharacterized kinase
LTVIEALVRIGGSLMEGDQLARLCRELGRLGTRHRLLVVPGGGRFVDTVRAEDRRYKLGATTAHWMAVLGMDQYGLLLSDLIPGSCAVRGLEAARQAITRGLVPVMLPFSLLYAADPLPHTWEVTSDSIAAWIAAQAGICQLVLLKDVDGLFACDPRAASVGEPIASMMGEELARCQGVDRQLVTVLSGTDLCLWVVNGNEPGRLTELFEQGWTRGTCCHATAI